MVANTEPAVGLPRSSENVGSDSTDQVVLSLVSSILSNVSHLSDYFFLPFGPILENASLKFWHLSGYNGLIEDDLNLTTFQNLNSNEKQKEDFSENVLTDAYSALLSFCLSNLVPLLVLWCLNWRLVQFGKLQTCLSIAILWLSILAISPLCVMGLTCVFLYRGLLSLFLRYRYGGRVFLPSAMDAVWGVEFYASPSINTGFYILEGTCDFNRVRETIRKAFVYKLNGTEMLERLKCSVLAVGGFVCWEKLADFNIDRQLRLIHTRDPSLPKEVSMSDVFHFLRRVHDTPFPRFDYKGHAVAPWEILVVPIFRHDENQDRSHYAVIFRMNHSLMDGISFGNILHACLADGPFKFTLDPVAPIHISVGQKIIGHVLALVTLPLVVVRNLTLREKHVFHGPTLTGSKYFAWSRPIRMDMLKEMKNRSKTSILAVLLNAVAGSMRHMFQSRGLPVPKVIHAVPPIAMLPYPDRRPRNKFAIVLFPIPIGVRNSLARLNKIYEFASTLGKSAEILSSYWTISILGLMPSFMIRLMGSLAHGTLTLSNMPGPAERVTLFGGDKLVDIGAWVPLKYSIGIGTAMFSYCDRLRVTFIADEAAMSNPSDVANMQTAFEVQLNEIAKSLAISENIFLHPLPQIDGLKLDNQG